ncbi:Cystatin Ovarian cystatin P12 [Triplophysa tibetana]|uniref:Cystatin Ovarian cystatin P12 n=1 Tax=Triplophysa tibetana TaxID=1572043 RepID=A0A5A9P8P3_9TELE|nr:Cystatin Ovarian cystatin P12 [Triplophysa tibetana]
MYVKMIVSVLAVILAVASAGRSGGVVDADMNDKDAKDALQFAVAQHNRESSDIYVRHVYEVVKVQTQVVSGIKYIFTVKMAKTSCRKGGVEALCTIPKDPANEMVTRTLNSNLPTCQFEVWSQPWLNKIEVVENTCKQTSG